MRKIKNPWVHKDGYNCFGCAPENPNGLHMEFFEDGDEIVSFWKPNGNFQGWINTMHGGVISAMIDETAGWVIFRKLQTCGVTTKLEVRFKKPLMSTDSLITLRGRITKQMRNLVTVHVVVENSMGEVCDEADAVYFTFGEEKAREMGFTKCELEDEEWIPM